MASVSEASDGCWAAREISQADVPMRAIEAPIAPAPSSEASARRRRALRAIPRVRGDAGAAVAHCVHVDRHGQLDDTVGERGQRGAVGHEDGRTADDQPAHGRQHVGLRLAVEAGGGLVEQEQRRVAHEGAGERDALAFAGGQPRPSLAQQRVGTGGQAPHDFGQAGGLERGRHLGVGRVGSAEPDVLGHRAGEEVGPLRDPADVTAPIVEVEIGDVHTAEGHGPGVRDAQAQDDGEERRLAAAAGAGDGHGLPRCDDEIGTIERGDPAGRDR